MKKCNVKNKLKKLMIGVGGICVLIVGYLLLKNVYIDRVNSKLKDTAEATTSKLMESESADIYFTDWYGAYAERYGQELNLLDDASDIKVSLAYLDDNDIPECIIWSNPYPDTEDFRQITVLSCHGGEVLEFTSEIAGAKAVFSYKEKSGKFCVEEILGLRNATWWEIVELTDGFKKIGSAHQDNEMTEWYYYVNEEYTTGDFMHEYLKSFGFDRVISGECAYPSLNEAYAAWNDNRAMDCDNGYVEDILPASSTEGISEQSLLCYSKSS